MSSPSTPTSVAAVELPPAKPASVSVAGLISSQTHLTLKDTSNNNINSALEGHYVVDPLSWQKHYTSSAAAVVGNGTTITTWAQNSQGQEIGVTGYGRLIKAYNIDGTIYTGQPIYLYRKFVTWQSNHASRFFSWYAIYHDHGNSWITSSSSNRMTAASSTQTDIRYNRDFLAYAGYQYSKRNNVPYDGSGGPATGPAIPFSKPYAVTASLAATPNDIVLHASGSVGISTLPANLEGYYSEVPNLYGYFDPSGTWQTKAPTSGTDYRSHVYQMVKTGSCGTPLPCCIYTKYNTQE